MIVADIAGLRRVLRGNRVIAVAGLSPNWNRPRFFAAKYMLEHGHTVIPINPGATETLGRKCYPDLVSIPRKVDLSASLAVAPQHLVQLKLKAHRQAVVQNPLRKLRRIERSLHR